MLSRGRDRRRVPAWIPRNRILLVMFLFCGFWILSTVFSISALHPGGHEQKPVFSCPPEPAVNPAHHTKIYSKESPVALPLGVPWFWGSRNPSELSSLCAANVDKAFLAGYSGQWLGKEKFLVIRFVAGFNNVRLQLEQGLFLAAAWGVTLVTPKFEVTTHNRGYSGATHKSVWDFFDIMVARQVAKIVDGDEWDQLKSSNTALEPKQVETVAFLFGQLPLNGTDEWTALDSYYRRKTKYYLTPTPSIDSIHNVNIIYGESQAIYLSTPLWDQNFIWTDFIGPVNFNCFRLKYIQAILPIQEFALSVINKLGSYSSIQLRRDDFPDKTPSTEIVKHIRRTNIIPDCSRVYLATDQKQLGDLDVYHSFCQQVTCQQSPSSAVWYENMNDKRPNHRAASDLLQDTPDCNLE
eukprot:TRINITY_DN10956_c0_g1_i1.p1 TRINITY_DN10956_c0_g1~~TRINITY_DN10956_c0_g1_i1.p1  ORF type:complete len:425 (-),score=-47.64 TRINITY_DN10956_c0_g1_i1:176-1402(-)